MRKRGEKKDDYSEEEEVEPLLFHFYWQMKVINLVEACDGRLGEIDISCVYLHYSSHNVAFDFFPSPPFHLARLQAAEQKVPYFKALTEKNFSFSKASKNKVSSRSVGSQAAAADWASQRGRAAQELN